MTNTKWIQFTVSQDNASAFHAALKKVEIASKLESGCGHYAAFVSKENPCTFTVLEIWDNDDSLDAHRSSPHLVDFKEHCASMILDKASLDLCPL